MTCTLDCWSWVVRNRCPSSATASVIIQSPASMVVSAPSCSCHNRLRGCAIDSTLTIWRPVQTATATRLSSHRRTCTSLAAAAEQLTGSTCTAAQCAKCNLTDSHTAPPVSCINIDPFGPKTHPGVDRLLIGQSPYQVRWLELDLLFRQRADVQVVLTTVLMHLGCDVRRR